ncbi:DUF167 domain-containing protein [uncultured Thiodictyon sp.]|uniref:DUF167 domain-containing protein n=1 Tax=uncultured Thiodictyon sp. TaxID=1846217 RepID=UPI0025E6B4AE|nr:DUF167 domain-containing protein [uncultured Thiodictyon sp.]
MMSEPQWYRWCGEDLEVTLRVQPRASQNCFVEEQGGSYRVRIQAAPVDGKANDGLRRFVADAFGVPQSRVELLSGEQSRLKRLLIRSPRRFPVPIEPPVEPPAARSITRR